ncbi:MAG: hypothetical protein NUV57_04940 [archaeon]|nr:hypothetical protein [archaeon]
MSTKNTILLIVKQNEGIDYNSLLNKFATSYSNINSARAALSRSLKDLTTFGFLSKKGNHFYILEKGEHEIYSEMKNKLVIGLNDLIKQKKPENDVDSIVSRLQIMIERGRTDNGLLKTSKSSLDFSISNLESVEQNLKKKIKHLDYISGILIEQINSLKELDFNDSFTKPLNNNSAKILVSLFSEKELTVECQNEKTLISLAARFNSKSKNNSFQLARSDLKKLLIYIEKNNYLPLGSIAVFSSTIKAEFLKPNITLSGPFSEVKKFKK